MFLTAQMYEYFLILKLRLYSFSSRVLIILIPKMCGAEKHTYTHTHTHIYMCVCVSHDEGGCVVSVKQKF